MRAVEDINRSDMLPGIKLTPKLAYINCESYSVIQEYIDFVRDPLVMGVIGPPCSGTIDSISGISAAMNMPIVSYGAEGGSFGDRLTYPFVYRTIGDSRE